MAGRIRTIKPEILSDGKAGRLSDRAWRLWVSMWTLADDLGNLPGEHEWISAQVLWGQKNRDAAAGLQELIKAGLICEYTVNGERYIHVRGWTKHQRIDKPSANRFPIFEETLASPREPSRDTREPSRTDWDLEGDRDLEGKGKGGEGEEPPALAKSKSKSKLPDPLRLVASAVLEQLNAARKRVIPAAQALGPQEANLEHIAGRLQDGHSEAEIQHVIAVCEAEVKAGGDSKWFNAVTPFRREQFSRKLAMTLDAAAAPEKRNGHSAPARNLGYRAPIPPHKETKEVKL